MTSVTLKHPYINSGNPVIVLCDNVSVSGKCNIEAKPNARQGTSLEPINIQKLSVENLTYSISGIHFTNQVGTLTYNDVLCLYKARFATVDDATYPEIELGVVYSSNTLLTGTLVSGTLTTSSVINVVLDSFSYPIDTKDSRNGYMPLGTMTFIETV